MFFFKKTIPGLEVAIGIYNGIIASIILYGVICGIYLLGRILRG